MLLAQLHAHILHRFGFQTAGNYEVMEENLNHGCQMHETPVFFCFIFISQSKSLANTLASIHRLKNLDIEAKLKINF